MAMRGGEHPWLEGSEDRKIAILRYGCGTAPNNQVITEFELYVTLGPVDDTLTRETRRVRVGVYAIVRDRK
jgi:hypothetical protein